MSLGFWITVYILGRLLVSFVNPQFKGRHRVWGTSRKWIFTFRIIELLFSWLFTRDQNRWYWLVCGHRRYIYQTATWPPPRHPHSRAASCCSFGWWVQRYACWLAGGWRVIVQKRHTPQHVTEQQLNSMCVSFDSVDVSVIPGVMIICTVCPLTSSLVGRRVVPTVAAV